MRFQLAIFDMDGTILNTLEDLTDATNFALSSHGYPTHTIDEVRYYVGNGIRKTVERALPPGTPTEIIDAVYETFIPYYNMHNQDKTAPYPGIVELLRSLRKAGCKTAVVSNKADDAVQALVQEFFPGLFDIALGEKEGINKKPAPDEVNMVLKKLDIHHSQAVYIGDSDVDIATAENSNLDIIAVDWGFRGRTFLEENGAEIIVSSAYEIEKIILTDLSTVKNVHCPNCGAIFPDNRDRCPHCQTMYEPGAERVYMDKLEGIRDAVDDLGSIPGKETTAEVKKIFDKLFKFILLLSILTLIIISSTYFAARRQNSSLAQKEVENLAWRQETYPYWDELYANGDYEKLFAEYTQAISDERVVLEYEHNDFLFVLRNIAEAKDYIKKFSTGYVSIPAANLLLCDEYEVLVYNEYRNVLTDDELSYVSNDIILLKNDLQERFNLSPKAAEEVLSANPHSSENRIDWDKLKAYVNEHQDTIFY